MLGKVNFMGVYVVLWNAVIIALCFVRKVLWLFANGNNFYKESLLGVDIKIKIRIISFVKPNILFGNDLRPSHLNTYLSTISTIYNSVTLKPIFLFEMDRCLPLI